MKRVFLAILLVIGFVPPVWADTSERLPLEIPQGWVLVNQDHGNGGKTKRFTYAPEGQTVPISSNSINVDVIAVTPGRSMSNAHEGMATMLVMGMQTSCETKVTNTYNEYSKPGYSAVNITAECTKKKFTGKSERLIYRLIQSEKMLYLIIRGFSPMPSSPSKEWEEHMANLWPCIPGKSNADCPKTLFTLE